MATFPSTSNDRRTSPGALRRMLDRRNLPLAAVLVLLVLLLAVTSLQQTAPEPLDFDPDSPAANGLRGLVLWLKELGYDVRRTGGGLAFDLPAEAALLFVYPNQLSYTMDEARALHEWVEAGNTLVLVGPTAEDRALEEQFGVRLALLERYAVAAQQVQPMLPDGNAGYYASWFNGASTLDLAQAPGAIPMLTLEGGEPVVAVQAVGNGVVWHLTPSNGMTNGALEFDDHGHFLPAILRTVPAAGVVIFDTYHQFGLSRVGERIATLQDWLYRTPAGWATLFAFVAGGLFLLLQGRRLGPAVPSGAERKRREAAEYVEAMANLARRAHIAGDVARHHKERLKRGLARRRPFSAGLEDAEFLARLGESEPALPPEQTAEIRGVLQALNRKVSEQELVELAAKVDALLATAAS